MTFPDHFSSVAAQYAASRPRYPAALFTLLADVAPRRRLAWDAGCGSGQASVGLAAHFDRVVATDASAQQIANAELRPNVEYTVAGETNGALADQSVDLVTVAQAVHWFNRPTFFREVERVLAPDGVLAIWAYELSTIEPRTDDAIRAWYTDVLGPYWPPERGQVETGYRDIGFPYATMPVPTLAMAADWTRDQLVAFLATWSAVKEYRLALGRDALDLVLPGLVAAWPHNEPRAIAWPVTLLVGVRG